MENTSQKAGIGEVVVIVFWGLAFLCFIYAGYFLYSGLFAAKGSPQESTVAAVAACIAIIPYCIARAVGEMVKTNRIGKN